MNLYLYLNRFCSNKISHRLLFPGLNAPSAVGGPLCARPAVGDEDGVGALEGLLHAHGAVRALAHVVRRVQRVLDAHHAGPRAVRHVLETKDIFTGFITRATLIWVQFSRLKRHLQNYCTLENSGCHSKRYGCRVECNRQSIPTEFPLSHLLDLLLGDDGAAVAHPDAALEVVEVLPVALEELDEEDAQVGVGLRGVDARVQLQEAHQQQDQRVRGQTAREDLRGVMV